MLREEITIRPLQWKCVESRADSKRLNYARFILFPLMRGQGDTIGIAMRRSLLGEMEGTCITRAKSEKIPHEYSNIAGIEESVHEILMNLKEIVLRSNLYGTRNASICVKGPGYVTAQDIISPPSVEMVDTTQHIASLTEPIDFCIELQVERHRGYRMKTPNNAKDGSFPIEAVFMPVRNANHSIHSYGNGNEKHEILFLEIWTNGSLTPKEALNEASRNLIDLFIPFLYAEEQDIHVADNPNRVTVPFLTYHDRLHKLKKNTKDKALKCIFIDQLELSSRVYNCLKKSNLYTLWDLLNKSQEDLLKIEHFRSEDVKEILDILQKNFSMDLPKNTFSLLNPLE
uniref:DNA-directed RNA polymerase subunit alpha n=1 Tax=Corydalis turtschaninovii TaxID=1577077 RepID=A0A8K1WS11_9MAGN|nr:RNA polymerase alpha subunit [Corydalis turtschaninovii]YP_010711628.1 RNA polymerase alpha subunit [Corydalis wandoensis]UGO88868.1 RNA polymerase alpha subunit [Corydalis turtschaninovii]WDA92003.1 RNA polymerase alpha subunit [Corydalis turtschaninovii]WDA92283.1 RNA polymerase alpha subunit [Corydalis wandoensis]